MRQDSSLRRLRLEFAPVLYCTEFMLRWVPRMNPDQSSPAHRWKRSVVHLDAANDAKHNVTGIGLCELRFSGGDHYGLTVSLRSLDFDKNCPAIFGVFEIPWPLRLGVWLQRDAFISKGFDDKLFGML